MEKTEVSSQVIEVASSMMSALAALNDEDKIRVISSVIAMFGLGPNLGSTKNFLLGSYGAKDEVPKIEGKKYSLVEFINLKKPTTNAQKIIAFIYYREKYESLEKFSKADILPMFAMAKSSKPSNYDRDFSSAVREGWIHEEGSNSYLTTSGEKIIEAGFPNKANKTKRKPDKAGNEE